MRNSRRGRGEERFSHLSEEEDEDGTGLQAMDIQTTPQDVHVSVAQSHRKRNVVLVAIFVVVVVIFIIALTVRNNGGDNVGDGGGSGDGTAGDDETKKFFDEYWADVLNHSPEFRSFLGKREGADRWDNRTLRAYEDAYERAAHYLQRTEQLQQKHSKHSSISEDNRLSLKVLQWQLQMEVRGYPFKEYLVPMHQLDGPQISMLQLVRSMRFELPLDYKNYVARLRSVPTVIDEVIALMDEGIRLGITAPRAVLDPVQGQLDAILENATAYPAESEFYAPFRAIENDPDPELRQVAADGLQAVQQRVLPAFERLREYWLQEYLFAARTTIAASDLPNGWAFYEYKVQEETTVLNRGPAEIHQLGLSEVARITNESLAIMRQVGFQGNYRDFVTFLRGNPDFFFTSEELLLAHIRDICKRADPELPKLFKTLPRCPYGVRPMPATEAPSAPAAYYFEPNSDCSRPGYYVVNTYDLKQRPTYLMESTTLHETVPGHHLQIALAQEQEVPEFRRFAGFTGFIEGWALYSESLGPEMGFYTDPYNHFGALGDEALRAVRLVTDTGMHYLNWTRDQARDYMMAHTPLSQLDAYSEIDRYIVWPGQALAYKSGELKFKELREYVREHLAGVSSLFDIREFHDVLLKNGALPLPIVEDIVRAHWNILS